MLAWITSGRQHRADVHSTECHRSGNMTVHVTFNSHTCSTSSGKNSGSSCDDSEMSENLKPEATARR